MYSVKFTLFISSIFLFFLTSCEEEKKPIVYGPPQLTTLDSLQGVWHAYGDSLYRINIVEHKWKEMMGGLELDEIKFEISDSCSITTNESNGRYLFRIDTSVANFCSKIEYLTDTGFAITNNNKTIAFRR